MNDGYRGSAPLFAKCPGVIEANPDKAEMQPRVRNRQETVSKRFKNWAILSPHYRHQLLEHQTVFGAIAILTQLSLAENLLLSQLEIPSMFLLSSRKTGSGQQHDIKRLRRLHVGLRNSNLTARDSVMVTRAFDIL